MKAFQPEAAIRAFEHHGRRLIRRLQAKREDGASSEILHSIVHAARARQALRSANRRAKRVEG